MTRAFRYDPDFNGPPQPRGWYALTIYLVLAVLILLIGRLAIAGQSAVADLRDAHRDGLPFAAVWNIGGATGVGYDFAWHVRQLRDGHRFVPSIQCPHVDPGIYPVADNVPTVADRVGRYQAEWAYLSSVQAPLILRHNNIAAVFAGTKYRLPKVPESIPNSPLAWSYKPALEDEKIADNLGPASVWGSDGAALGKTLWFREMQQRHPSPAWVMLADNHEAMRDDIFRYLDPLPKPKAQPWYPFKWKSQDQLRAMSVRVADLALQQPEPWQAFPEWCQRDAVHYRAWFGGLNSTLSPGWQGFYTGAYSAGPLGPQPPEIFAQTGPSPESEPFDAVGPSVYPAQYMPDKFTDPALIDRVRSCVPVWEYQRAKNPRAFREVFLTLSGDVALRGKRYGVHEQMSPERWGAFCEWVLWQSRSPGVPVLLHYWSYSQEWPTDLFFCGYDYKTRTINKDLRGELVEPSMGLLTEADYIAPIWQACDRICESDVLREFWQHGTTLANQLPCSVNAPLKTTVWATAAAIGPRVLIYAWTPCRAVGEVSVTVNGRAWKIDFGADVVSGYWLIQSEPSITKLEN